MYKYSYFISDYKKDKELIRYEMGKCKKFYSSSDECLQDAQRYIENLPPNKEYYIHLVQIQKAKVPMWNVDLNNWHDRLLNLRSDEYYKDKDIKNVYKQFYDEFEQLIQDFYYKYNDWNLCEINGNFLEVYKVKQRCSIDIEKI